MSRLMLLCFAIFVVGSLAVALQINKSYPIAEMDEVFHISQASLYCYGIYDQWNPKITTLPGLYIFSVGPLKILQTFVDIPCSVFTLRMFNVIINSLSFILIYYTVLHFHALLSEPKRILVTFSLAIFPLNYFFTFLYYTDPLSTTFILLMHLMWLRKSYNWSALAGFSAVITRQTSIVWVFFHGMLTINEIYVFWTRKLIFESNNNISMKTAILEKQKVTIYEETKLHVLLKEIIVKTAGYLLVGISFGLFLYVNNGIAVGDRDEHTVTANFPQILYFTLFVGLFTLPHLISQFSQIISFGRKHKLLMLSTFVVSTLIVQFNTVAHHYNIEGIHHFTHYFLNLVYYHHVCAILLVPIYVICSLYIVRNSISSFGKFMAAVFIFCLVTNLTPQLLLEFRYFVPGYFLFRMRVVSRKWKDLLSEFALYFCINLVTIALYLVRPVSFPEDKDHQILMW